MRARGIFVLCPLLALFFPIFSVSAENGITGLWVLEIESQSTTTKTDMVVISKVNGLYEINPDDGEWEVAAVENFQVKDDAITFTMGGIVSCMLKPDEAAWSGKCAQDHESDSADSFSVILRLPEKPASTSSENKESE